MISNKGHYETVIPCLEKDYLRFETALIGRILAGKSKLGQDCIEIPFSKLEGVTNIRMFKSYGRYSNFYHHNYRGDGHIIYNAIAEKIMVTAVDERTHLLIETIIHDCIYDLIQIEIDRLSDK